MLLNKRFQIVYAFHFGPGLKPVLIRRSCFIPVRRGMKSPGYPTTPDQSGFFSPFQRALWRSLA
ncbi:MAG: hypothetical protein HUU38_07240 [Anaerolineales bacterium]|nr:hypothetical protein [Anaerolineales bacterium]